MYLVGDLSDRNYFKDYGMLNVKANITRDDLAKTKSGEWQVINLSNLTFFDPYKNKWIPFDKDL